MEINFRHNGRNVAQVFITDQSFWHEQIMDDNPLYLYFSATEFLEIPLGATCQLMGETFTLYTPPKIVKINNNHFEYSVQMYPPQALLKRLKFKNTNDHTLNFPLTATPQIHLQMLVENLNAFDENWRVGSVVFSDEKLISYNFASCQDALNIIAETFKTEWQIIGKTIHLGKVKHWESDPLPLSYGRGNGFVSGVSKTGETQAVTRLYVQGGNRNIDPSTYRSKTLLLPKEYEFQHNGTTYQTDPHGHFVQVKNSPFAHNEAHLDLSDIYPQRKLVVSQVTQKNGVYFITDNTIEPELDFEQYQIKGEKLSVYFESGMLSGREFDANYNHPKRAFELITKDEDGTTMPNEIFSPQAGDKFAVFGMMLPQAYIENRTTKSGASFELLQKATEHLEAHKQGQFVFKGELDGIWAKKNWENIGGKIVLGGVVLFSDEQFHPEPEPIRIVSIKRFVTNPHSPVIELSNEPISAKGQTSIVQRMEEQKQITQQAQAQSLTQSKRQFYHAQQTTQKLKEHFENYQNSVRPLSVQTMQLLVGDPSLQFRFVRLEAFPQIVDEPLQLAFSPQTKQLQVGEAVLLHQSLGITEIKPNRRAEEYPFWVVNEFVSGDLSHAEKSYFLYAKVGRSGSNGNFLLSEEKISLDAQDDFYHLLIGILNPEFQGERSFAKLFGFTEILPGQITANRISSSDGRQFIDLGSEKIKVVGEVEIQGESVTAGRLFVGNKNGANAGIFGDKQGSNAVRFASGFDREHFPNNQEQAIENAKFRVLEDGKLISKDAEISGHIEAKSGKIGHFVIDGRGISSYLNEHSKDRGINIDSDGIIFRRGEAKILFGWAFAVSSGINGMFRIDQKQGGIGSFISVGGSPNQLPKFTNIGQYIHCTPQGGSALYLNAPQGNAIEIIGGDIRVNDKKGYTGDVWIYNRILTFEKGILVGVRDA